MRSAENRPQFHLSGSARGPVSTQDEGCGWQTLPPSASGQRTGLAFRRQPFHRLPNLVARQQAERVGIDVAVARQRFEVVENGLVRRAVPGLVIGVEAQRVLVGIIELDDLIALVELGAVVEVIIARPEVELRRIGDLLATVGRAPAAV